MTLPKRLLQWAATPVFSPIDTIPMILAALAWHDKQWFAVAVFVVVGAALSVGIERLARRVAK
jgi:hypothetical protein